MRNQVEGLSETVSQVCSHQRALQFKEVTERVKSSRKLLMEVG